MKIERMLVLIGWVGLCGLSNWPLTAQTGWQTMDTLDRLQYLGIATGASGEVYAAGELFPVAGSSSAVLRRSLDEGRSWRTIAAPPTPAGSPWSNFRRVCASRSGQVYVLRVVSQGFLSHELWWAPAGTGGSNLTWATTFGADYLDIADIATDSAGNAYVCGQWNDPVRQRWHTLKGTPGANGLAWSILDDYAPDQTNHFVTAKVMSVRPSTEAGRPAEIWVGGVLQTGLPPYLITFRRTVDGGATWQSAGSYEDNDVGGGLRDLAVARDGTAYAVGRTRRGTGYAWLTRRSSNGGANWEVVDDVGNDFGGFSIATDDSGRVIATGPRWASSSSTRVRVSNAGAAGTWGDSDDFGVVQGGAAISDVVIDEDGNAYICGAMTDAIVSFKGVIRKLVAPEPERPNLAITLLGSQIKVSWPAPATGFFLQSARSLTDDGNWEDVTAASVVTNGHNVITFDAADSHCFFRLRKP